jgi:competence ComEA-like helix-hairpin-helix protein
MKKFLILFIFSFLVFPLAVLASDKVEINTASLKQLDEITGIGLTLAQRIIDARPFSSIDDLLKVKGIGEKTLQKIKNQGLAYVGEQPPEKEKPAEVELPPTPPLTYPDGVVINEIMPNPERADEQNEWIEIFNQNNFEVDLSGWKIKDKEGKTVSFVFPKNTKITAGKYLIFKRPDIKITLNNDKDGIEIINPNEEVVDSVGYEKAPKNQSYNKTESGWQWSGNLTPGSANIISSNNKEETEQNNISKNNQNSQPALAASAKGNIPNLSNKNAFPYILASFIAISSAFIILLLKTKLER